MECAGQVLEQQTKVHATVREKVVDQAIPIEHFNLTNAFFNYTVKGSSPLRGTKFRLSVNNLLDKHNIVGITAAAASAHPAEASGDVLTLLPGRSVMLTVTFGFAPSKR